MQACSDAVLKPDGDDDCDDDDDDDVGEHQLATTATTTPSTHDAAHADVRFASARRAPAPPRAPQPQAMAMCIEVCFVPRTWDPRSDLPVGTVWTHANHNLALDLVNQAQLGSGRLSSTRDDGGHISPRHI